MQLSFSKASSFAAAALAATVALSAAPQPASGAAVKFKSTNLSGIVGRHQSPNLSSASKQISQSCTASHTVVSGESCTSILNAQTTFRLTLDAFVSLNKEFDPSFDCGGLTAGQIVCLQKATDDPSSTSPQNATTTSDSGSGAAATNGPSPDTTNPSTNDPNNSDTPASLTPTDPCSSYITTGTSDNCTALAVGFKANVEFTPTASQLFYFMKANPSVNCLISPIDTGKQICMAYTFQSASSSIVAPTPIASCLQNVTIPVNATCDSIATAFAITQKTLYDINIGLSCPTVPKLAGKPICVNAPGIAHLSTTSKSSAAPTTSAAAPSSSNADTPTTTTDQAPPPETTSTTEAPPPEPTPEPTPTPDPTPVNTNPCKSCGVRFDDNTDYVTIHNQYRALYGLGPLSYDATLEADATRTINNRACANIDHDLNDLANRNEGENLIWFGTSDTSAYSTPMGKGVSSWMDEDSLYYALSNGGSDPTNAWNAAIANNEEVGHFTQIIWGSTSRVGCASRTCKNGQWNVWMASCRYQARGNIFGANGLPNPLTA